MVNKVEIKKALYKQKPTAQFDRIRMGIAYYNTMILDGNNEPIYIKFEIPVIDMGEADFESEMEAKLLNRWIVE